jgi:hypothetical protein
MQDHALLCGPQENLRRGVAGKKQITPSRQPLMTISPAGTLKGEPAR